ncbi:N-6 DNA methylase, partial [Pseudomonas aeruginosa]
SYEDVPGFCYSASYEDVQKHGFVLTPGRYVGAEEVEDDDEPFGEKMDRLTDQLVSLIAERNSIEQDILQKLKGMGYEF